MAKMSPKLRNDSLACGFKNTLQGGIIKVFTGAAPTNPQDADAGTLLMTITDNAGARTAEVLASGTITLTGGASGSVDTVTVNGVNIIPLGAVPFNGSLAQTAADLAAAINQGQSSPEYEASAAGAVVTIRARPGTGTGPNGFVVTATLTTITASYANMSGGVAAVNGLRFGVPANGVLQKLAQQEWKAVAANSGIAGYARVYGPLADAGAADLLEAFPRLQVSVGASGSGAELILPTTNIVAGVPYSVSQFMATWPQGT